MNNIFDELQHYVADTLNAELSGKCTFLAENRKDIDFEIKNALGRQGLVAVVMTPKATYAGKYEDQSLVWECKELEIDIVENVAVNRGRPLSSFMTALDAGTEVFNVLCPLSGEHEGRFCPVSLEEGEDGSLLVVKSVLKCLVQVKESTPPQPWFPSEQGLKLRDGTFLPVGDAFFQIGNYTTAQSTIQNLGYRLSDIVEIDLFSYLNNAAGYKDYLSAVYVDESCQRIGGDNWSRPFSGSNLEKVVFKGRTLEEVQAMANYPWGIADTSIISTVM